MGITQIGIEVGRSYSRTFGGDTLVVTALASPWAEKRIAELEAALRNLVADVDDYERVNNLAPSPGKLHCWQSMRDAKALLGIDTETRLAE